MVWTRKPNRLRSRRHVLINPKPYKDGPKNGRHLVYLLWCVYLYLNIKYIKVNRKNKQVGLHKIQLRIVSCYKSELVFIYTKPRYHSYHDDVLKSRNVGMWYLCRCIDGCSYKNVRC